MLIDFKFNNFRSFKNDAIFSMKPSSLNGINFHVIETNLKKIPQLYKTSGIFGPNASGKSNIIMALHLFKYLLKTSFKSEINDLIEGDRYLFNDENQNKPTSFEISFIFGCYCYKYGFEYTPTEVLKEFLTYTDISEGGSARENGIFYREKGSEMKAKNIPQSWINELAPNRLFLSEIINNRHSTDEHMTNVYSYIINKIQITRNSSSKGRSLDMLQGEDRQLVLKYIKNADLGIENISVKKLSAEDIMEDIKNNKDKNSNKFAQRLLENVIAGKAEVLDIAVSHKTEQGKIRERHLEDESEGTKVFIAFAAPIIDTLKKGNVLFVDELDASLHPSLVRYIVEMFNNPEINKNSAQLIFTSYAFYLMDGDALSRDQIWFTDKKDSYSSSLYSLRKFDEKRKNKSFIETYMKGNYGSFPQPKAEDFIDLF